MSKYTVVNGSRCRDLKTLRAEVLALLKRNPDGMPKTAISDAVKANRGPTKTVLDQLRADGKVEIFEAENPKRPGRYDVFWTLAGRAGVRRKSEKALYRAAETLQAFQLAARGQWLEVRV